MGTALSTELKARATDIQKALFSEQSLEQIKAALPSIGITPERLARVAFTAITKDEKLLACNWQSLIRAIIQCSQYGLVPDGRQAHLVPYKNEATLIIDYKGLVTLIRRSPSVSNMFAYTIHKNDQYTITLGTDPDIKHTLPANGGDRGDAIFVYSVIRYKDGGFDFDIMSKDEVEKVRDGFAQKNFKGEFSKAWRLSFEEMMKKTVIRRHSKTADISYNVAEAIENDIRVENGEGIGSDILDAEYSSVGDEGNGGGEHEAIAFDAGTGSGQDDTQKNAELRFAFEKAIEATGHTIDMTKLYEFVAEVAKANSATETSVMIEATAKIEGFLSGFFSWLKPLNPGPGTGGTTTEQAHKTTKPRTRKPPTTIMDQLQEAEDAKKGLNPEGRQVSEEEQELRKSFTDQADFILSESFPRFNVLPAEIIQYMEEVAANDPGEHGVIGQLRDATASPQALHDYISHYLEVNNISPDTYACPIDLMPNQPANSELTRTQLDELNKLRTDCGVDASALMRFTDRRWKYQALGQIKAGHLPEICRWLQDPNRK